MGKDIGENISKHVSGKYSPGMLVMRKKLLDHTKESATDVFKTALKRGIQKTTEATDDFIGNKIAYKIIKVSKNSQQNNSETATNKHYKEVAKERYISPEERQETIDELRL